MLKARGGYATLAEMNAFSDGVEWANDSALTLIETWEFEGKFWGIFEDEDYHERNEPQVAAIRKGGRKLSK